MSLYKKKFNPFTGRFDYVFNGNLVSFKAGVATVGDLPVVGNEEGDARITNDTGHLYIYGEGGGVLGKMKEILLI